MSSVSSQEQQQQHRGMLRRQCFACSEDILVSKPDANSKWIKKNLDGVTDHVCSSKNKQQQQSPTATTAPLLSSSSVLDKIAALTGAVTSLDRRVEELKLELIALKAVVLNEKQQQQRQQ
jgi:hypothetical protein